MTANEDQKPPSSRAAPRAYLGALFVAWAVVASGGCLLAFPHDFHVDDSDGGAGGKHAVCGECAVPADCPDTSNPCVLRTCDDGCCGEANAAPESVAITGQAEGDCTTIVCDGHGQVQFFEDDTDVPSAKDACHAPACLHGTAIQGFVSVGNACSFDDGVMCDGAGRCVQCMISADCDTGFSCTSDNKCEQTLICGLGATSTHAGCDMCLTESCCPSFTACFDDPSCQQSCLALGPMADPSCTNAATALGALYVPFRDCVNAHCLVCGNII